MNKLKWLTENIYNVRMQETFYNNIFLELYGKKRRYLSYKVVRNIL